MAEIISIAQEKGGGGKSTTAVGLASILLEAGAVVALIDTDEKQLTTSKWCELKNHENLYSSVVGDHRELSTYVDQLHEHADVIIIDTSGFENRMLPYSIGVADLVLIPAKPSIPDKDGIEKTYKEVVAINGLRQSEIPTRVVFTDNRNTALEVEIIKSVHEAGYPILDVSIPAWTAVRELFAVRDMQQKAKSIYSSMLGSLQTEGFLLPEKWSKAGETKHEKI